MFVRNQDAVLLNYSQMSCNSKAQHPGSVQTIVCTEPGCCAFELQSDEHTDIRRQTSAYFKASPWLLLEFTEAEMSLENIFLKLTDSKGGKK